MTTLLSRSLDEKCLRCSTNSRLPEQKNYLFPLKERARKKIKKCSDDLSVLINNYEVWTELLGKALIKG